MPKKLRNAPFSDLDIWNPKVPPEGNVYNWLGKPIPREPAQKLKSGKPTFVDLFCGAGGFSTGFEWAGFQTIFGLDIHRPSLETFADNHPTAYCLLGDIRTVSDETLLEIIEAEAVDVLAAGVPCQGFSLCNRKRYEMDERNFLFREFIRAINLWHPKVVVLENVSGMISTKNGAFVRDIKTSIEDAGYKVDSMLLHAAGHGVPQIRRRLFFIGAMPGLEIRWPAPTYGQNSPDKKPHVTVWQAIGDLPPLEAGESKGFYTKAPQTEYQQLMRGNCKELLNHEAPNHPPETVKKIGKTPPGKPIYPKFTQRIRLHPDRPSPTQVSGGIRPQFQFGHPTQSRGLTVRERARIQSFPDFYFFKGGIVQGRVQTGNAVPPILAKAIAEQIMDVLCGKLATEKTLQKTPAQLELCI